MVGTRMPPIPASLKRIMHLFIATLFIYVLFVLVVMLAQRRLLYFPTRLQPSVAEQMATREGLTPWRDATGKIVGWKLAATARAQGSVLVIHGNAGCALDRSYIARPIHDAAPVDVYLLEYPGYGTREGSPSQQSFLKAAEEGLDLLPKNGPIHVVSESIGAGVAAHLAQRFGQRIAGMMLFVPYDNLVSVAREKMPWLPVRAILWDRFDPAAWMKNYRGPVGFMLAEKDEIIPSKFGLRLHDGYAGPKMLEIASGAGHNDVSEQSSEWWKKVFAFWREHQTAETQED